MISREEAVERIRNDGHPWKTVLNETVTMLQGNRLLHRQFFRAFNHGDTDALEDLITDDYALGNTGQRSPGQRDRAALMRMAGNRLESGEGPRSQMIDCVAEGDRVVHWSVNYPGDRCFVHCVRNGKLARTISL